MWRIWVSISPKYDWPLKPYGPRIENQFGKPGTLTPSYAWKRFVSHHSPRLTPAEPRTSNGGRLSVSKVLKPVAQTRTSSGCSRPSAVLTPVGVIASISVVSSRTLLRLNVGRYSLEKLGRLQ